MLPKEGNIWAIWVRAAKFKLARGPTWLPKTSRVPTATWLGPLDMHGQIPGRQDMVAPVMATVVPAMATLVVGAMAILVGAMAILVGAMAILVAGMATLAGVMVTEVVVMVEEGDTGMGSPVMHLIVVAVTERWIARASPSPFSSSPCSASLSSVPSSSRKCWQLGGGGGERGASA